MFQKEIKREDSPSVDVTVLKVDKKKSEKKEKERVEKRDKEKDVKKEKPVKVEAETVSQWGDIDLLYDILLANAQL